MNTATAKIKNINQSPRKVRLVANLVKGKSVEQAILLLDFAPKKASLFVKKAILSAFSNAKQVDSSITESSVKITKIDIDGGQILKRTMPRARGSANLIRRRTSHINVALEPITSNKK